MRVSVTPRVFVLRIHDDPADPVAFSGSAVVTLDHANIASVEAMTSGARLTISTARAIRRALLDAGATGVAFTRRKKGMVRRVAATIASETPDYRT